MSQLIRLRNTSRCVFVSMGLGGIATAVFGGHGLNLSAITARAAYLVLGPWVGFTAAFIVASPSLLIQAVARLPLQSSLASSLTTSFEREAHRLYEKAGFVARETNVYLYNLE